MPAQALPLAFGIHGVISFHEKIWGSEPRCLLWQNCLLHLLLLCCVADWRMCDFRGRSTALISVLGTRKSFGLTVQYTLVVCCEAFFCLLSSSLFPDFVCLLVFWWLACWGKQHIRGLGDFRWGWTKHRWLFGQEQCLFQRSCYCDSNRR